MALDEQNPSFQQAFPSGNIQTWRSPQDSRANHIAWVAVDPLPTPEQTRSLALGTCERIVDWLRSARHSWAATDRVAIVVGFSPRIKRTGRRIVHGWAEVGRIDDLVGLRFSEVGGGFEEAEDWARGLWDVSA